MSNPLRRDTPSPDLNLRGPEALVLSLKLLKVFEPAEVAKQLHFVAKTLLKARAFTRKRTDVIGKTHFVRHFVHVIAFRHVGIY
jgi:predicted component of type VI protein secretion system